MKKYFYLIIFVFSIILLTPHLAQAATLRLVFDEEIFNNTGQALVSLELEPTEGKINAIGGELVILSGSANFSEIQDGNSIISVWLELPHVKENKIIFSGIIPGGFSGFYSPFKKGPQPGVILTTALAIKEPGKIVIGLKNFEVYADNGEKQSVTIEPAQLEIQADKQSLGAISATIADITAPGGLSLEIINIPGSTDWFAAFSAFDNDSGIDHYEIQEGVNAAPDPASWQIVENPWRLEDQKRRHRVFLKAVDRNGNETIISTPPQAKKLLNYWFLLIGGLLVFIAIIYYIFRRRRN